MRKLLVLPSMSKSAFMQSPCIWWARPGAQHYDDSVGKNEKRDIGVGFHSCMDELRKTGTCQYRGEKVTDLVTHGSAYLEKHLKVWPTTQSEVVLAVNWSLGKAEIVQGVTDRNYPYEEYPGYQFGTVDLLDFDEKTKSIYVGDWKTGKIGGGWEQLASLAWGLRRSLGWDGPVTTEILQVTDTGVEVHQRVLDADDLENHRFNMMLVTDRMTSGKFGEPTVGAHCLTQYCPHMAYCKAMSSKAEGIVSERINWATADNPADDSEAGEIMLVVSAMDRRLKYLKDKMKGYVKQGGRVVCGDQEWKETGSGYRWTKR